MAAPDFVVIAEILRPHGLRGDLKVAVLSDDTDRLAALDTIWIGERSYRLIHARPHQGAYLIHLEGIDDTAAADALRGAELTIPLAQVAPLEADAYYHWEIIGMAVATLDGQALGTVREILPTGSNDVLVVQGGAKPYFIPTIDAVIKTVDTTARLITIDPLEGLLDL